MKIYVDTSGLFAALARSDVNHSSARQVLERLLRDGMALHATSYTLLEMLALLQRRVGGNAVDRFDSDLRPALQVAWVDERLHEKVMKRFSARRNVKASIVDCSAFVLMEEEGIRSVFTFDRHFETEGFTIIAHPRDL